MKQEVVISVKMKHVKKAMEFVVGETGVLSVAIEGADKIQMDVVGEGVDPVKLMESLRKEIGFAELVRDCTVQDKEKEKKKDKKQEKQEVVISVKMKDVKKAIKFILGKTGVLSVGANKIQIVVVGEGVDPVKLLESLRKEIRFAELVRVCTVQDKEEEKKQEKQKVVISVKMEDVKKAMKFVVGETVVLSAAIRADKIQMDVVGEGVDPVKLMESLRNEIGFAELVSFSTVQDKKKEMKKEKKQEKLGVDKFQFGYPPSIYPPDFIVRGVLDKTYAATYAQEVVISVQMKHVKKAMEFVVGKTEVLSVAIRADKIQMDVVGEGVDPVNLMESLRKEISFAELVSFSKKNEMKKEKQEKKKVVISVKMEDVKKAMKFVVGETGVLSAAREGADKNQIVVIGEGVGATTLTTLLRKSMGSVELVSVSVA